MENYGILHADVRFDNEAEFIKSLGGKIIEIVRPNAATTKHSDHVTEKGISTPLIDAVIRNNGTIEQYQEKVILAVSLIANW